VKTIVIANTVDFIVNAFWSAANNTFLNFSIHPHPPNPSFPRHSKGPYYKTMPFSWFISTSLINFIYWLAGTRPKVIFIL
jgi:hypothetical protein